ncbi:MAG: hypothetical protein JWN15_823 [Firmicutes bacterium]|nr:hypothetical protein [Bacillota bacterium]
MRQRQSELNLLPAFIMAAVQNHPGAFPAEPVARPLIRRTATIAKLTLTVLLPDGSQVQREVQGRVEDGQFVAAFGLLADQLTDLLPKDDREFTDPAYQVEEGPEEIDQRDARMQ